MHSSRSKSLGVNHVRILIFCLLIFISSVMIVSASDSSIPRLYTRKEDIDDTEDTQTSEDVSSIPSVEPKTSTTTNQNTLDLLSNSTTVIGSKGNPSLGSSNNNNNIVTDPRKPASRLFLIKPKPNQSNPPLFPIGGVVEFEWAFDSSLLFPPSNLTIDVNLNSDLTKIWPIANVSGSTTRISWDTSSVKEPGLTMGFYTLNIYDSSIGRKGAATGGHLVPSSDLRFGLYVPGASIPKTDEKYCATCRFIGSANGRFGELGPILRSVPWMIGVMMTFALL